MGPPCCRWKRDGEGWKRREQTGPMCVCSAAENNVHTEALMRFKNNGDYLHYSLGITRAGDALAFAPRLAATTNPRPAIPRFLVLRLPHERDTQTRIPHTRENSTVQNYSRQNNAAEENSLYRYYNPTPPPPPPRPKTLIVYFGFSRVFLSRSLAPCNLLLTHDNQRHKSKKIKNRRD